MTLGVASALTLMVAAQAGAQGVTNLVQTMNIQLTGYYQAAWTTNSSQVVRNAVKVSVKNSDIISLLGLQMNLIFSKNAKLMVKRQVGEVNGQVYVRDTVNGQTVDTLVDPYFTDSILVRVPKTKTNLKSYITTGSAYTAEQLQLNTTSGSFNVSGFITENITTMSQAGTPPYEFRSGTLKVSGTGNYAASPAAAQVPLVLTGTVSVSGRLIEK